MSGKVSTNTQQAVINLDPRTKLYTLMVFSLVMVPSSESELDTILKIVFAGLAFLMLINIRRPGLAAVYAVAYCAAYGANGLLAYISGMSLLGIIIRLLVEVVLRMMPTLFIAMSFLQTTKVSEFVAAMEKMHITRKITIPFAVIFRFFPTVADEYHSIQDAMKKCNVIGKEEQCHEQKTEGFNRVSLPLIRSGAGGWANISGFPKKI